MIEKQDTFDSEKYRRWIASLPCVVTGKKEVQCAHIRKGYLAGASRKPPDWRALPLYHKEHSYQHKIGELKYWYPYGGYETAAVLAKQLYEVRFNTGEAVKLIEEYRRRWVKRHNAVTFKHQFIDEGIKNEN